MIAESLTGLAVPVEDLRTLEGNPRRGDVAAVARSLKRFGQRKPIVARRADGVVVAGNHTLAAARELGWAEVAVSWVDDDDATAKAYALADNRTSALGTFDNADLAAMVAEVQAVDPELLEAASFDEDDLNELLAGNEVPEQLTDPDEVPEPPAEPVSKPGDLWLLGPHRVLCGDATSVDDAERVMDGQRADCMWTDPPYGVSYQANESQESLKARNRRTDGLVVENDDLSEEQLGALLREAFSTALVATKPGAAWYVAAPPGPLHVIFAHLLNEVGVWRQTLVWLKDQFVFGRQDYHYRHEPIFYGWAPGAGHYFVEDRTKDTILDVQRPRQSKDHPTMKPVELVARCLTNSCPPRGLVYEPFGGSGTTLLAAHALGQHARVLELDPRYVDVILRRFAEHTGITPTLEGTGEAYAA